MNNKFPNFMMNIPSSFDTKVKNNVWMEEYTDDEIRVNKDFAYEEMKEIYSFLSNHGFVHLLPTPPGCELQDLVFVANNGIVLPQFDQPIFIAPNYKAENRRGEENISIPFFEKMGFEVVKSPYHFEGEADLKYIKDNIYIGGYGCRSDIKTYEWLENRYGLEIIKVEMTDLSLYHLDCSIFPLTREKVIVATDVFTKEEVRKIEEVVEVIPIEKKLAYAGLTNSVKVGNTILNGYSCDVEDPSEGEEAIESELAKQEKLEKIASENGMNVKYFELYEFLKGGALLSCMVLNLNYLDKTPS